ncbi:MAG: sigma-54 dependent transcriptional regulator [Paludibacteraceae bacterium]|nr:sigma-54 dependent transcriptional regulator [Paludibacteraceae bacterium]HOU67054.1 sigma-54 dependent transcriptional regulator [Paludibacteraceae bacterium]HQF49622.1 sigma-54 dependent transcriptional regulator [Paludibacteraceae bacterium]
MINTELQQVKQRFGIIGSEPALDRAIDVAVQVAATDLSVLITGESGVGKERFPQIIHQYSVRKHGQYIAVNCGAIPEGTIDSELFGHEKGSFTGAVSDRKGYFEVADKGTIFLDEVGELPLTTQVRLLRVLEAGEFIKVGSSKVQKTDVRVVAATNMDMPRAIAEGRFREDLFYRLNSVPIVIPPLRDRGNDIVLLFRKFAVDFADKYRMPAVKLTPEATQLLLTYPWPGNVRQLKNITEQISVLEQNREISKETLLRYLPSANNMERLPVFVGSQSGHSGDKSFNSEREILYQVLFDMKKDMDDLKKLVHDIMSKGNVDMSTVATPDTIHNIYPNDDIQTIVQQPQHPQPQQQSPLKMSSQKDIQDTEEYVEESFSLEDVERDMIKKALERHNNRRKYAAQDLKISERTLYRKIKEYGLE